MPRRNEIRHPRSRLARWTRRIVGIAATLAFLAVGVAIATMVVPGSDEQVVPAAPAATPKPEQHAKAKPTPDAASRKPRLTRTQREQRRLALDQVRRAGYTPVKLADYDVDHVLRVLIGKPVGTTPKGLKAFFFVRGDYIGNDASTPSLKVRPGLQLERQITLVYTLYDAGDRECCPQGGDTRVHFRWTGAALEPQEQIPPGYQRMPSAFVQ